MAAVYEFDGTIDEWTPGANDSWIFLALPQDVADEVLEIGSPYQRGFGSLRVEATIGATVWRTSVFPSAAEKTFVLPVKKAVRTAEGLVEGGPCTVRLRTVE